MKLYRTILAQSWQTTIHQPHRWVFGLFAALLIGNGGEIDRYLRYLDAFADQQGMVNVVFWSQQPWFKALQQILPQIHPAWLLSLSAIAALLIMYMVTIAQGSLIISAAMPADKKSSFATLFNSSQKHVVPLFILNTISYLIIALTLLGCSMLSLIITALLLLPVILIVSFVNRYAASYIVLENKHLAEALLQGWKLLWRYFNKTLVMALVIFGLAVIINLGIVLAIGIVIAPFFSNLPASISATDIINQLYTINTIGIIIYTIAVVIMGAIISTWQWTAWTLLFQQLNQIPKK